VGLNVKSHSFKAERDIADAQSRAGESVSIVEDISARPFLGALASISRNCFGINRAAEKSAWINAECSDNRVLFLPLVRANPPNLLLP